MPEPISEEVKEQSQESGKQETQEATITLTKDQYEGILARFEELEEIANKPPQRYDVSDELAQEVRKPSKRNEEEPPQPVNLDNMSQSELAKWILTEVGKYGEKQFQELNKELHTQKLTREIEKASDKYEDFYDYEDAILEELVNDPKLNVDKAYKIVKGNKSEEIAERKEKQQTQKVQLTRSAKILNLPSLGERQGLPPGATESGKVLTMEESIARAFKDAERGK